MAEFSTDREPRIVVERPLFGRELFRSGTAGCGRFPACQFKVALLRIRMAVSVHTVDAGLCALVLEALQLIDVAQIGRYQATAAGERSGFIE